MDNFFFRSFGKDLDVYAYANTRYLKCVLDTIAQNYGTVENYMAKALDFDKDKRMMLRELYLE